MDTATKESRSDEMARWAEKIEENPESLIFYYGIPDYPPLTISTTDNQIIIRAEAPGLDYKDFNITVAGRSLRIQGERKRPDSEEYCHSCNERPSGEFSRLIFLPPNIDNSRISASYTDGILTIKLLKKADIADTEGKNENYK